MHTLPAPGAGPTRLSIEPDHIEHGWHKCYMFIRPGGLADGWSRDRVIAEVVARGTPCYSGSYLEKAFDGTGWRPRERLPVAKELGQTSVMFPVHPTLTADEIDRTLESISEVARMAQR